MSTLHRLDRAFADCLHIPYDARGRFVFLSDCHRGIGDGADDFAPNAALWHAAMAHYWREGYTYFELGDGDELWENRRFDGIVRAHRETFAVLEQFHRAGRLHMLYGNHDIVKRSARWREKNLQGCIALGSRLCVPLLRGLSIHEALILDGADGRPTLYLCHGNQADLFNSTLWRMTRFFVHSVWVPLSVLGLQEPFRLSENPAHLDKIERKLAAYGRARGGTLVAGHTHRPILEENARHYANDGCCVHPGEITALELIEGRLQLVEWRVRSHADGTLYAGRRLCN
ncbi:MAG: serine/threonine protein phosphatase [Oscillospiraceae bacterium]|jgi:UDP-2,3-diacylglucosamine pyrophosphatase LpxH|nr:serine/threonine protein phosphatase [Oscillospiraceae bacterium]